jgi:hypothetical protein
MTLFSKTPFKRCCRNYIKDVYGQETNVIPERRLLLFSHVETVMERGLACTPFIVIDIGDVVALKRKFNVNGRYVICNFYE